MENKFLGVEHEENISQNEKPNLESNSPIQNEKYTHDSEKLKELKEHQNLNIASANIDENGWVIFLGESKHKIKKKAEQEACRIAIEAINNN